MDRPRVTIIGAGNVATHLAVALDRVADVERICSRHMANATALASRLDHAQACDVIGDIPTDCDYYIISVNDDAIAAVAAAMPRVKGIVAHTSGSVGIEVLDGVDGPTGVFYPLQTFSKDVDVDISQVPFFIEADTPKACAALESLAASLSKKVYRADSSQRAVLHIAAVFGCNFVNHLLDISSQILQEGGFTLDVLYPLLKVTVDKAMDIGPDKAQTGPAARGDVGVIARHLDRLDGHRRDIYRLLSESIMYSAKH